MTARDNDDPLVRAKTYPYFTPPYSYLLVNGAAYEIVEAGRDPTRDGRLRDGGRVAPAATVLHDLGVRGAPPLDERIAVLAHGSNAAPETLARKYARFDEDVVIPVIKARLAHFDVVYATHFSGYGSIPSTLAASGETVAEIAVNFLTPHQLALMHECELSALNYVYGRLDGLGLALEGLGALDAAHVYVTRHGYLGVTGAPLAFAAIAARAPLRPGDQDRGARPRPRPSRPGPRPRRLHPRERARRAPSPRALRRAAPPREAAGAARLRGRGGAAQPVICPATIAATTIQPSQAFDLNLARQSAASSMSTFAACQASWAPAPARPR